jgi:hypothetical protein
MFETCVCSLNLFRFESSQMLEFEWLNVGRFYTHRESHRRDRFHHLPPPPRDALTPLARPLGLHRAQPDGLNSQPARQTAASAALETAAV